MEEVEMADEMEYTRITGIRQERLAVCDRVISYEGTLLTDCSEVRT